MTPQEIIDLTRELKPSVFSNSALLSFLNEVEKNIYTIMGFEDNLTKASRYLTVKKCEYTEAEGDASIFSGDVCAVCTVNEPISIDDANVLNTFMHVGNPEPEGGSLPIIPRPVFFNTIPTFIVQVTPGTAGNATVRLGMQGSNDSQGGIILPYLFKGYTNLNPETASNENLLLPDVYKYIYAYYIASQIDYYSNDIPSYNNNMTLYNNAIADFAKLLNGRRTASKRYNYNYEGAFRK